MVEELYDCGRLCIRQLGKDRWIGMRSLNLSVIKGTQASHIRQRHDCLEAAERRELAGIGTCFGIHKAAIVNRKEQLAGYRLCEKWLTRKW